MSIYWLEQTEVDVPEDDGWLGEPELGRLHNLRIPKRRADWRLGRWTAKHAVAAYLNTRHHLVEIEIRPAPSGAPEVFLGGKDAGVSVSLTHRAGVAACTATESGVAMGCDLELIEPRSDAFVADYFTAGEQATIHEAPFGDTELMAALLWSAKESTLKALQTGLRDDPRTATVRLPEHPEALSSGFSHWSPLEVTTPGGRVFYGWWQKTGFLVRTIVSAPTSEPPMMLSVDSATEGLLARMAG